MAFVKIVPEKQATGLVKEEYDRAIKRVGYVAQVLKISSLAPEFMKGCIDFYITLMRNKSKLPRYSKEAIAVVVSKVNHCHY